MILFGCRVRFVYAKSGRFFVSPDMPPVWFWWLWCPRFDMYEGVPFVARYWSVEVLWLCFRVGIEIDKEYAI